MSVWWGVKIRVKIWSSQSKTDHLFLKWLDNDLTMKQAKKKWLWLDYDWLSQNNDYNMINLWMITQLWLRVNTSCNYDNAVCGSYNAVIFKKIWWSAF